MRKTIFDYDLYKAYLTDWLAAQPRKGRGLKSALAAALACQPAYISQVLQGPGNFSLEQADLLNSYLGHGEAEAEFFLLLVQWERAGSHRLREHFARAAAKVRAEREELRRRLRIEPGLTELDRARYYSSWRYVAVHILLTIPGFGTRAAIAGRLGLELAEAAEILAFLVRAGLAEEKGTEYRVTKARIHLGTDSPELQKHHINWRLRAMGSVEREKPGELHYSSVISLSRADLGEVRETLVRAIEAVKARVKDSPEEELCAFSLDLFHV